MPIRNPTPPLARLPHRLAHVVAWSLVLGLGAMAMAQRDASSWTRLVLAEDAAAACGGTGLPAAAHGATVQAGSTIDASGTTTAPSYWNPVARVRATIVGAAPDYTGCWFDATVEVRTFQHACTFAASATLFAGDRPLTGPVARAAHAGDTVVLTFRSRLPRPSSTSTGGPVFVDLRLAPLRGGCPG